MRPLEPKRIADFPIKCSNPVFDFRSCRAGYEVAIYPPACRRAASRYNPAAVNSLITLIETSKEND
jgi:hypothetical protein